MTEYYIEAMSFAAPFVSDKSHRYVEAASPSEALSIFNAEYKHPCGLYYAACWDSADAKNKDGKTLAEYLSPALAARKEATKGLSAFAFRSLGPGVFEVDGKAHHYDPDAAGVIVGTEGEVA